MGKLQTVRRQRYGWASNGDWNEEGGYWNIHCRRDMFAELMECESQEEFFEIAGDWIRRETDNPLRGEVSNFNFIIMNLCLSYQAQKRESKVPWTFRNGDNNWDRYDDFFKEDD